MLTNTASDVRKIIIIEDDRKTTELLRLYLEREGYEVMVAADGRTGLDLIRQERPHLVILDLMLPKVDGLDICRILRYDPTSPSPVPIIILTARTTEDDILLGLDLGADDYITKPFSPRQVTARVRAVLRRTNEPALKQYPALRFGELEIDIVAHEARLQGRILNLTPREFKLLETMVAEPGRAFKRLELLEKVFGLDYEGLERTVDAHIMNLRKKLEIQADSSKYLQTVNYIQTVYGIGYRFVPTPQ